MDLGSISTEEEVLAEPDIPGLWSKEYKTHQVRAFPCQVLHRFLDAIARLLPHPVPATASFKLEALLPFP